MNKKPDLKIAKSETESHEKKKRIYYSVGMKGQSFYVAAKDEDGKRIPLKDGMGSIKTVRGKIQYAESLFQFECKVDKPGKYLSTYEVFPEDPLYDDKVEALEKLCKDEGSPVHSAKQYEQVRNPEASGFKEENAALKSENAELKAMLDQMKAIQEEGQASLAEMQKQIDDLTKPKA